MHTNLPLSLGLHDHLSLCIHYLNSAHSHKAAVDDAPAATEIQSLNIDSEPIDTKIPAAAGISITSEVIIC
ncbi:hypothetical protein SAMN05421760_11367 [Neptunomonas antarctica]|uniref:Uncharacterized protein n=1 Tax=Neptunomonas antarctica TaxID=619304 RepID=A0A1N7P9F0_9GAMM|nr:hypothetical protein SAMN05421760_11367 [Neptunomonas antarctica]